MGRPWSPYRSGCGDDSDTMSVMGEITLLNCDCMDYMAKQPDNAFDLAIVRMVLQRIRKLFY